MPRLPRWFSASDATTDGCNDVALHKRVDHRQRLWKRFTTAEVERCPRCTGNSYPVHDIDFTDRQNVCSDPDRTVGRSMFVPDELGSVVGGDPFRPV